MHRFILIVALVGVVQASAQQPVCSLPWEADLTYQLNTIESSFVRTSSGVVSDALMPLSIAAPVVLYGYGVLGLGEGCMTNRVAAQSGVQIAATMGATYLVTLGLKAAFDRDRPYQAYPDCITNYRTDADGSMPSGHSAGAAALATSLSLRYPQWYVIVPSVTYALWTGFSRMNLGMHYLSDVLAGYAIGAGVALGIHALRGELFELLEPVIPDDDCLSLYVMMPTPSLVSTSVSF